MPQNDRRVKRTRHALQQALIALMLERDYETITVQAVLDRANVGRSTFYAHFYDLDDLLQSEFEVLQADFDRLITSHPSEASIWDLSRILFHHALGYQRLYKVVVGTDSGRIIQAYFHRHLSTQIRARLQFAQNLIDSELVTLDVLEHYLASSFMALLGYWLDNEMPQTADEMAQIYQLLVKPGLDNLTTGPSP